MTYQLRGRNENSNKGRTPGVNNPNSFWETNPDALSRLLELREQLLSSREMSVILHCTRNTVIGKLARLGLTTLYRGAHAPPVKAHDAIPEREKRKLRFKTGGRGVYTRVGGWNNLSARKLPKADVRLARPAHGKGKHILKLGQHDCRFSVGFDKKGDYIFCAKPATDGSWCGAHAKRVFKVRGVA